MTAGRIPSAPGRRGSRLAIAFTALLCTIATGFALTLPALSGRVVDRANIISTETRTAIEQKLADLETKSGIQLVVATVSSLDGEEIEPYANELFRSWKLGEKTKNNGVLLLVAPNQRRVRIEVGYGLEGTLTDALSQVIIANAITPGFKGGSARGGDDIITVLTADASEWQKRPALRLDRQQTSNPAIGLVPLFLFIFIFLIIWLPARHRFLEAGPHRGSRRSSGWGNRSGGSWGGGSSGGSWSSGGSDSGGGFSGGSGSSGGGGASGGGGWGFWR